MFHCEASFELIILAFGVDFSSFDINSSDRAGRTKVFASSTTDTFVGVDDRNLTTIVFFRLYHHDSSRRAMTRTIATLHRVCRYDAVFLYPYGIADLN
jgi:hypothetical protein